MAGEEFLELEAPQESARLRNINQMKYLLKKFEQLPESDKKLFAHGPYIIAVNGGICGLIANSFFRRILNITEARITSSLPMAFLPFLTTAAVYHAAVTDPILSGHLTCATCATVRGALTGAVLGGLYPIIMAIAVNGGLATRYNSAPLPGKENLLRFWIKVSQPVFRKMMFPILLQAATATYLSAKQHAIFMKMLRLPETSRDPTELGD
uniref:Transmembrane protein 126A n=1 Tax=Pelusios castaneus TaxID=367368 RepID=A0A8C8VKH7_9SAUR